MFATAAFAAALLAQAAAPEPETGLSDQPAPAATDVPAAKPAEPKKVCVVQPQLGSHFKKRICATPAEWEERRRRDAEEMAKMQSAGQCRGEGC